MSAAQESGAGSIGRLGRLLDECAARRLFLVTGQGSFSRSGAEAATRSALAGRQVTRFCDFSPNPDADEVRRGVEALREAPADVIVAIGGGSVIDMAKLVNACAAQDGEPVDVLTGRRSVTGRGLPVIAIPTTAGSGAEATHFATVYVDRTKYSLASEIMRPAHVILDPDLTASLPALIVAQTGLDALAQAIESTWSVRATDASRTDARSALRLAHRHLRAAVAGQPEARDAMLTAANLAGKAIDVSRTTAPHALSYALTSDFGIAHGHAVGLTLAETLAWNAEVRDDDVTDPRGADHVRARIAEICADLGCPTATDAALATSSLMRAIGLSTRLSELGVTRADLPRLVRSVNDERLANNPRRLPADAIGRVLDAIY